METTTRPGTPLRHRMLDDMRMRKFAEHTQDGYIRAVRKLPVILGPDEVGRLIAAAPNLKHQAAMSVAYGAGLRVSEVVAFEGR